jgi:two-component system, NarL family, response regulator NreC
MEPIRVFLADDHIILRQGIKLLINEQPDMEVVGEAGNGKETVEMVPQSKPDVVVMDVSMPELNGLQATKRLKHINPQLKILALTRHSEKGYVQQLLAAGVCGYALKQTEAVELLRGIRTVMAGSIYLDSAIAEKVVGGFLGQLSKRSVKKIGKLSEREEAVLQLIARGYSNNQIADRFTLSVKTIEAHKANAMEKLELHSRVEIVRYAILQGWLEDD